MASQEAMQSAREFCGNQPEALVIALATAFDAYIRQREEAAVRKALEVAATFYLDHGVSGACTIINTKNERQGYSKAQLVFANAIRAITSDQVLTKEGD
jgi:hypothetical protein